MISTGDSNNRVHKITRIHPTIWKNLASRDEGFRELLEKAESLRDGGLAAALRESMMTQIKKGHPWWAKLAIHNFNVLLKDPDVTTAVRVKRMLEKVIGPRTSELLTTDPSLAEAALPPGTMPSDEEPGEVQDDSCGTAKRKD